MISSSFAYLDSDELARLKTAFGKLVTERKIQPDSLDYELAAAKVMNLYLSGITDPAEMFSRLSGEQAA